MKRTVQLTTALLILLAAVQLVRKYRELQVRPPVIAETPATMPSDAALPPAATAQTQNAGRPATASAPSTAPIAGKAATPEEELAAFREPRYVKMMNIYTQNFAAYAKLRYVPIDPKDRIEDVVKALQPVLEKKISNDVQTKSLAKKYGDGAIQSLSRHLAIVLLRFSGLDAEHYLEDIAHDRDNRLYVPDCIPEYRLALSTLLPNVPVVGDDANQKGLRQIFDRLSAFQLQGRSGANNQIIGWSDDAQIVRLQLIEAPGNDIDGSMLKIGARDDLTNRHYYSGGILLGSMVFTSPPPPKGGSNKLLAMFNGVVRTSNDFYTIRVALYYDALSDAWHLREVSRGVSPRPAVANPMVF